MIFKNLLIEVFVIAVHEGAKVEKLELIIVINAQVANLYISMGMSEAFNSF